MAAPRPILSGTFRLLCLLLLLLSPAILAGEIFITAAPGLPSQEDLGLTPEKLYNMTVDYHEGKLQLHPGASSARLAKRLLLCRDPSQGGPPAGYNNAMACAVYLYQLADQLCTAWPRPDNGPTVMCVAGGYPGEQVATVAGRPYWVAQAETYCANVAFAVFSILGNCPEYCVGGYCGREGTATPTNYDQMLVHLDVF